MSKVELRCFCGQVYMAREADIKRGWGKTCSKSCAAIKRESKKPNATCAKTERKIDWGKKYKRPNEPLDKRYVERAKQEGYYPFNSENEMYEAMCDNPIEGR
ncbi:hypothetical protein [Catenovulum sediminis]|uniref:Uncharacterized protein n=1 Tax=Catenovulum sediminis TaxID=1740262 RepID=A0ABV1RHC7_9ALTE